MKFLRKLLDEKVAVHFEKDGRFEKLYAVYEMHDTILFTPGEVNKGKIHVRDGLDLKRMMITVVAALMPCVLFAMYNIGYQAHTAIEAGALPLDTWQTSFYKDILGLAFTNSLILNMIHGALYFLPVIATTFIVGGIIEVGNLII
jgi:Na+-transporting NADH:ubiquinone oxidoreductase subunit B